MPDDCVAQYKMFFSPEKSDLGAKQVVKVKCTFIALAEGAVDDLLANKVRPCVHIPRVYPQYTPIHPTGRRGGTTVAVEYPSSDVPTVTMLVRQYVHRCLAAGAR